MRAIRPYRLTPPLLPLSSPASDHQKTAIDVEGLSRDDGCLAAGEIHDERRDFIGLQTAADRRQACLKFRHRFAETLRLILHPQIVHAGTHRSGTNGIDRDSLLGRLHRQGAHQPQKAMLARRIGRPVQQPILPLTEAVMMMRPYLCAIIDGQGFLRKQVRHGEVDIEQGLPEGIVVIDNGLGIRAAAHARIVHEDINVTQMPASPGSILSQRRPFSLRSATMLSHRIPMPLNSFCNVSSSGSSVP